MATENTDEAVQLAVDKLVGLKTYYVYAREEVTYKVKIQAHDDDEAWEIAHDHAYGLDDIVDGNYFEIDAVEVEEEQVLVNSTKGETK
jgi:hypothetical protein